MGIAKTSKRLKLRSESSARFERGIDPDAIARNAERAMELFAEVAGARVAPESEDVYPASVERQRISVRTSRVNHVLGTSLDAEEVWDALAPLGIEIDDGGDGDTLIATAPTFRPDLEREIDLVEEVARRVGFDHIGRTVPKAVGQVGALTALQTRPPRGRRRARRIRLFRSDHPLVGVSRRVRARRRARSIVWSARSNPLRAEESVLRTRVLPGLLQAVAFNRSHGVHDVALFEQGHVFLTPAADAGPLPEEPEHLAAALAGTVRRRPVEGDRPVDVYDAVDALRAVVDALEIEELALEPADIAGYRPGRSARVLAGGAEVGAVGEVADAIVAALGLERPVVAFEVVLDALVAAPRRDRQFQAASRFPPSSIDLAFAVADTIPAGAIARTLHDAVGDLLEDVRPFDVFQSDALGAGRRSIAFALRFRAPDRTLTDSEIADLRQRAIDAVTAAHGAELRG